MNDKVYCGNEEALIDFLYDECAPGERDAIAAHVSRCVSCAEEVQSLRLTRSRLTAWTPPGASLGFRITPDVRSGGGSAASVLTSTRWWKQPLPAWAQMAAAVAIFAAGMMVGASRGAGVDDRTASNAASQAGGGPSNAAAVASVSRQDFEALRTEIDRLRGASAVASPGAVNEDAVVRRVSALVDQRVSASENRLRTEFNNDRAQLVRDFQTVRARDLQSVQASFAGLQQVAGQELMQQREALRQGIQLIGRGQVVPTSLVR